MSTSAVKERLTAAAFALFDERGFESTTVSDIAERAGVGRATVFRSFPSKEDLIFPDHETLLAAVRERLAVSSRRAIDVAVDEALTLVLRHYTSEGDRARVRYRLTSSVPALAVREATSVRLYQKVFFEFFRRALEGQPDIDLRAELAAAAVVTAHNHVLRRWLRGTITDPEQELRTALGYALAGIRDPSVQPSESSILIVRTGKPMTEIVSSLQLILGVEDVPAGPIDRPRAQPGARS